MLAVADRFGYRARQVIAAADTEGTGGWRARLALRFAAREGRSQLAAREHRGPLQVQRAFHPEGDVVSHVYLLHPPGGLVCGDELEIEARVEAGAHALLTTPAATKMYRGDQAGRRAEQRQRLSIAAGAALEWLPQETILFDGARGALTTLVDLEGDARFVGWELVCLGRPAAGERFATGVCRLRIELWRDGLPLVIERATLEGGGALLAAPWGLRQQPATGTMLVSPAPPAEALEEIRALGARLPQGELASASAVDGALVCRYLGQSAGRGREHFARVWAVVRPLLFARPSVPPRIWMT